MRYAILICAILVGCAPKVLVPAKPVITQPPEEPRKTPKLPALEESPPAPVAYNEPVYAVYVGMKRNCAPCEQCKKTIRELERQGWIVKRIGDTGLANIWEIEAYDRPDLVQQYGVTHCPTWLLRRGSSTLKSFVGVMSPEQVREFVK